MSDVQQSEVIKRLTDILDELKIGYAIGGSIASSIYGTPRFTQDADITVQPFLPVAERLYEMLKDSFYISKEAMYQAIRAQSSFNIIHFETAFKIDIFTANSEFEKLLLTRSKKNKIEESINKSFSLVSPEDIILLKLKWYKQSDFSSDRQWTDVLGVLSVQKNSLDFEYLKNWAKKLGLNELLQKVISESGTH
ncbi:MAG: hypothetical protein NTW93_02975 [Phycisphaerae bacterium]|nr:hypothetical protein [Phycisphaerae bacterium]